MVHIYGCGNVRVNDNNDVLNTFLMFLIVNIGSNGVQ